MTDITMPRLSDSMEEGTILSWLKQDGDEVAAGEELVEIETDKATMTYESPEAGTLAIIATEGTTLAVGTLIATVGSGSSNGSAAVKGSETPQVQPIQDELESEPTPESSPAPAPNGSAAVSGTESQQMQPIRGEESAAAVPIPAGVRATPLARRTADQHGIALGDIHGTGPRGRITRQDVAKAASLDIPSPVPPAPSSVPSVPQPTPVPTASTVSPDAKRQDLTRIQQVIAKRMAEAKSTVPHFQVETEARMDALLALRAELKGAAEKPPSVNDFIVKAAAIALREFPLANGSYRDDGFELHDQINVGVAVATDDALVVPTVTDADERSVGAISSEIRRLAAAVRDGSVTPVELSGATFTVSNLGMYGMTAITPIITPPQAGILGIGSLRPTLFLEDGVPVEHQLMTMRLSADHRILYGAVAADFLSRIKDLLEQPLMLAL